MRHFISRMLLFSSPFILILILYFILDPFKVVFEYNNYYSKNDIAGINRAHVSTKTYSIHNSEEQYDSFIFGNSRSLFYEIDDWKQYLPVNSKCFHFDASGGSICGLVNIIKYIDSKGGKINNALIVLDYQLLSNYDQTDGYLFISPPVLKHNSNFLDFHWQHLNAFLTPGFLMSVLDYSIFGVKREYMGNYICEGNRIDYDLSTNEIKRTKAEDEISNGIYYDSKKMKEFIDVQRPGVISDKILKDTEVDIFVSIKDIFDRHNTSYKIVISPLYDQVTINPQTLMTLRNIFGGDKVFDFSGINNWTSDFHNYYESSHYRPVVSSEIMRIVYETENHSLIK